MVPGVEVIEGDCLAVMEGMADASVDAVVTDPPFGIGFDYSGKREPISDPVAYWDWLCPRYESALRCLRPGGFVAVWQTQVYFRHFWDWFGPNIHIYCAAKNFVQIRPTPINYAYDPVVMFYKVGVDPLRPDDPPRNLDFSVGNTSGVISDRRRPEKGHPCPRPLDQVRTILENFVLPGGMVLDPFAGSGTTGLACLRTGRSAILIEAKTQYVEIVHRRLTGPPAPLFDLAPQ